MTPANENYLDYSFRQVFRSAERAVDFALAAGADPKDERVKILKLVKALLEPEVVDSEDP